MGTNGAPRFCLRQIEPMAVALIVAATACFYFWSTSLSGEARMSRSPDGHYNLQAEGFRKGHLYASVDPSPALLALADPYDPVANAAYRIHDMSLWHGRYYLYFGVAPVLLVFLPFRIVTGYFVGEPTVVALFSSLGVAMAAALLYDLRRRWFQTVHPLVVFALVAALGLGSPTLFLNQLPQFYQVPISCAYALLMGGLFCIARVFLSGGPSQVRWLAAAGTLMGLTLAARPNYILAMPVLLVPAWWCARGQPGPGIAGRVWLRPVAWAFGPVAAVGAALLVYNGLRFGNPLEFGMRYQLAGQSFIAFTPLGLKYFIPHLATYTWQRVWWLPYFPFVTPLPEAPFGVVRYLPIVWLVLGALLKRARPGDEPGSAWGPFGLVLLGVAMANLCMDSVFFFAPELRYLCDFAPTLVLLGACCGLGLAQTRPASARLGAGIVAAAGASVAMVLAVYLQRMPANREPKALARAANTFAALVDRARGRRYGGLGLDVALPSAPRNGVEPLFQTGYTSERRDWLQVRYLPKGHAQLGFFHAGLGVIEGAAFAVPKDLHLKIEVFCSAFLPPDTYPLFAGWSPHEIDAAERRLSVSVNGAPVLDAALPCYPSRPADLVLGRLGYGDLPGGFSGRILATETLAEPRVDLAPRELAGVRGPLKLRVQLPALGSGQEPLIATGKVGEGQLLYLVYGPDHTVQFALDTVGQPAVVSRPVHYKPANDVSIVEAWMGSWAMGGKGSTEASAAKQGIERILYLKYDDAVIFDEDHLFHPGADFPTALGWNRVNSGAAAQEFSGLILSADEMPIASLPPQGSGGM